MWKRNLNQQTQEMLKGKKKEKKAHEKRDFEVYVINIGFFSLVNWCVDTKFKCSVAQVPKQR